MHGVREWQTRMLQAVPGMTFILAVTLMLVLSPRALAQGDADLQIPGLASWPTPSKAGATLFQNVRIFDGKNPALSNSVNVLVTGKTIERISSEPIRVDAMTDVRVIAANGRVLMPGLIDAHGHALMAAIPQMTRIDGSLRFHQPLSGQARRCRGRSAR
jgi:hypothetical protein